MIRGTGVGRLERGQWVSTHEEHRGKAKRRQTPPAAALSAPAIARAQPAWPTRPIRWIVPFAPGGGTDTVSCLIADQLSRRLGQTVVVDNKGGAGGNIGTVELARAAPDGYTLGLISVTSHTLNPMLY